MPSFFYINVSVSFERSSTLRGSGAANTSPFTGGCGRDKWLRCSQSEFSSFHWKAPFFLHGCQADEDKPRAAGITQRRPPEKIRQHKEKNKEIKRGGFAGSFFENLQPSRFSLDLSVLERSNPGLFSFKSQGVPFLPQPTWVSFCHLQLKKTWLTAEGKSCLLTICGTFSSNTKYHWCDLYIGLWWPYFPNHFPYKMSISAQTSRILLTELQNVRKSELF